MISLVPWRGQMVGCWEQDELHDRHPAEQADLEGGQARPAPAVMGVLVVGIGARYPWSGLG
jgi:hypothetical protein